MKKILFIYNRPHSFDIANYPFFHKLVEVLQVDAELSLLDMSNSNMSDLTSGIKHHFPYRNKLFTRVGLRRLNPYVFKLLVWLNIIRKRYDHIIVLGANSIDAIPLIRKNAKAKLTYIDDEFPWIFLTNLERVKECLSQVDLIACFDEPRKQTLFDTLGLPSINSCIIPNIASAQQLIAADIDWVKRLNLNPAKKYILFHGSLGQKCQLPEILCTLPLWDPQYDLIIIGWKKEYYELYRHLLTDRVVLNTGRLNDAEYSSLIQFCYATLGLYSRYIDRDQIGMSSGRVLRSVMLGIPVIANDYPSMSYVEELGAGKSIHTVLDIPQLLTEGIQTTQSASLVQNKMNDYYHQFKTTLFS